MTFYVLVGSLESTSGSSTATGNSLAQAQAQSQLQFMVSVTEPSDAGNARMAKQTEGRRLALSRQSPPSFSSVVDKSLLEKTVHLVFRERSRRDEVHKMKAERRQS
jgi:hypothetical protein